MIIHIITWVFVVAFALWALIQYLRKLNTEIIEFENWNAGGDLWINGGYVFQHDCRIDYAETAEFHSACEQFQAIALGLATAVEGGEDPALCRIPKIFEIGDCDCWVGYEAEETLLAYIKQAGIDREDLEAEELSESEMDRRVLCAGSEGDDIDDLPYWDALVDYISSGQPIPGFFSTTEY